MKPRTLISHVLRALGWGVALAGLAAPAWSSDPPQPAATGWSPDIDLEQTLRELLAT